MHDTHLVEALQIDIAFDHLPTGPRDNEDAQACLATFMRGTALEIVDAVFDAALPMDDVWRIDRLDIDLGRIAVEDSQDWREQWARALRTRLQRLLGELRDAPIDPAGDRVGRHPMHRRQSQLETLLFFLRRGRMPWYAGGRRADDPRELARDVLRHRPRELATALRHDAWRGRLLRRLAAQFDDAWLADLVRALLPTEPTAVARLLDVVQRARRPGRADDDASSTRLWEAVLDQAFAEGSTVQRPDVAVTRLQLQLALQSEVGFPARGDPLLADAPAWRRLLHDDRAWLRETLQRMGRSQALERRLARTLSVELLPELASLWLPTGQTAAVTAWIEVAATHAPSSERPDQDVRRDLWEAALSHLLSGGGAAELEPRRFARKLSRHPPAPRAAPDTPVAAPALADPLRGGPAWWALLRADPDAMRDAVRQHVHRGEAACRQLARDWSADMLLEAVCLQAPQSRQLVAAAISSPPQDTATREIRWASTLQYVHARGAAGPLDERAYMIRLARDDARIEGRSLAQVVARWNAAVLSTAAAPAWLDRIVEAQVAGVPDSRPRQSVERTMAAPAPALPHLALDEIAVRPEEPAPRQATGIAGARSFAGRVVAALAALAGTLGHQVARVFAPGAPARTAALPAPDAVDGAAPMGVGNAGLVLIGPYLPRLFEALGLLSDGKFVDARASERAVHLLQYAIDGLREAAPESELVLNKVLCGLDPAVVIGRRFNSSSEERALVDGLLGAVIEHWSILGSTTAAGLRETFLQRRARLERRPDGGWTLTVEPGSFDILIDRLPWGYAMQKHAWMREVLHVEWR